MALKIKAKAGRAPKSMKKTSKTKVIKLKPVSKPVKRPIKKASVTKVAVRKPLAKTPPSKKIARRASSVTVPKKVAPLKKIAPAKHKAKIKSAPVQKNLRVPKKHLPTVVALSVVPSQVHVQATNKPDPKSKKIRFLKSDLAHFKNELLTMRDRIIGQSGAMRHAALQRNDETNPEEDGTDAFLRLQTLEQVSSQQQLIVNIDESLRALVKGAYGICEACGQLISKERLSVLPFAKNCISCQSEMECPRAHGGRK